MGKSTVWGILCWIMFGKMPDGLRASDLKSWQSNEKGYKGKLWVGRDLLVRSWHPNKLTWNGAIIEQVDLNDKLGLTYETFLTAVLLSQGEEMFFDFSPAKKLSIFTSVLNLDTWTGRSVAAKEKADEIAYLIEKLMNKISRLEGKIDGLGLSSLKDKKKVFRDRKKRNIDTFVTTFKHLQQDVELLKTRQANAVKHQAAMLAQKKVIKVNLKTYWLKLDKKKTRGSKISTKLSVLEERNETANERVDNLTLHKDKKCSACSQHISSSLANKQIKKLMLQAAEIEADVKEVGVRQEKVLLAIDALQKTIAAAEEDLDGTKKELVRLDGSLHELEGDLSSSKSARAVARHQLSIEKKSTNPYKSLLEEKEAQETRWIRQLKTKGRKLEKLEHKKAHTLYWVQGFKDLRLYLIKEALLQLEIETNKALNQLGFSGDWEIKYYVDRQAKKGSLVSGFNVYVKSPYSTKQVPFAVWSGGEKQRLKIAGSMGLISLVSARTGTNLGLEVYDEPTQHLSPEGIDSLLETLRTRALETSTRIWLVDHHTLDYGDFSGSATVTKKIGGSEICQSFL